MPPVNIDRPEFRIASKVAFVCSVRGVAVFAFAVGARVAIRLAISPAGPIEPSASRDPAARMFSCWRCFSRFRILSASATNGGGWRRARIPEKFPLSRNVRAR